MCLVTVYYVVSYWHYPLKNILGDTGCHIANILRETGTLQIQLHSFIMATTRYIFLFHDDVLLRFNLTTHVSAILFHIFDFNDFKCSSWFQGFTWIMVGLNVFFPLFYSAFTWGTISLMSPVLRLYCLGEEYKIFFLEKWTATGTFFETAWTWSLIVILGITMSNILDFYFIYSCSKEVKKSDENVKTMMSNQAYLKRKR